MAEEGARRPRGEEREEDESEGFRGIRVRGMQLAYDGQPPLFIDFDLKISPGSRCLLVGANGARKTTLLKISTGKHMVGERDVVRVLTYSAFHDTQLFCSGDLAYLGGSWSKSVGLAGEILLQGIFSAEHMIFGVKDTDPDRRDKLIELLDIDLQWRMHKVLLLDEVTIDLDIVTRIDLLDFFTEECEQRGATIVYAAHIFDGLDSWATHLAYIQDGELRRTEKLSDVSELKSSTNMLSVVESWLYAETKLEKKNPVHNTSHVQKSSFATSPFFLSRHMAYYR